MPRQLGPPVGQTDYPSNIEMDRDIIQDLFDAWVKASRDIDDYSIDDACKKSVRKLLCESLHPECAGSTCSLSPCLPNCNASSIATACGPALDRGVLFRFSRGYGKGMGDALFSSYPFNASGLVKSARRIDAYQWPSSPGARTLPALGVSGPVLRASPFDACSSLTNRVALRGKWAVIKGEAPCDAYAQMQRIQEAGAIGAIFEGVKGQYVTPPTEPGTLEPSKCSPWGNYTCTQVFERFVESLPFGEPWYPLCIPYPNFNKTSAENLINCLSRDACDTGHIFADFGSNHPFNGLYMPDLSFYGEGTLQEKVPPPYAQRMYVRADSRLPHATLQLVSPAEESNGKGGLKVAGRRDLEIPPSWTFSSSNGNLTSSPRNYAQTCCADGNPHQFFDGVYCVRDMSDIVIPAIIVHPQDATWKRAMKADTITLRQKASVPILAHAANPTHMETRLR